MKEKNFYDDAFEKQLKEKSDQFKMYPSDKVWGGIYNSIHSRRKRFVAGMSFLIGGIFILAGAELIIPAKNVQSKPAAIKTTEHAVASLELHPFNPNALTADRDAADKQSENQVQNTRVPFISLPGNASGLSSVGESRFPVQIKSEIEATPNADRTANIILPSMTSGSESSLDLKEDKQAQQKLPAPADVSSLTPASEKSPVQNSHIRNDRYSWEIYITPTINTHHLSGVNYQNINPVIQNAPITVVHFANVNGFVDNTAAMGYDLGGNIKYRLSNNFSLKAGLQFSFSRYYIKAYNANGTQATAALSSYFGYITDSLANYSPTGTGTPKNPQEFQNKYYQLSIPVGIEWKVAGQGRLQFYVGATLQPSYLLNRNAYVLSTDYSSYTKDPAVFRRWNLQAGTEAFVSYRIGKIRWELGPQIRYQFLSTYKSSYPLGENLVNYGIRLGFSKTIR